MSDARASQRGRPERRHLHARRAANARTGPETLLFGITPRTLLVLFLVALVVPINFGLAGLQLTAYNSLLIVFLIRRSSTSCATTRGWSGSTSSWR